ncbi:choice-of-anchor A family protein [Paraglaciecola sp.]|uniref:choice-of-anchor A family protein n=1 Tax=Paraglaciecola sp. TaxID=1920173 RepID=UPI0030F3D61E
MRIVTLLMGLVLTSNVFAGSINLGTAGKYNAFVKNDFTATNSDTQGRVAVGGNLNVNGGYDIGFKINDFNMGKGPSLVVGGDVNKSGQGFLNVYEDGKHLSPHSGELVYAGNINHTQGGLEANLVKVEKSKLPVNFDDEFAYLNTLSNALAKRTTTGTIEKVYSELKFNASGQHPTDNVYVFNVTEDQLNSTTDWNITGVSDDATIVFNINKSTNPEQNVGQTIRFGQTQLSINGKLAHDHVAEHNMDNRLPSQVLFNFAGAAQLDLQTSLVGTILAPSADIKANPSVIWGSVIGKSWQGNMQINHDPFKSSDDPVPPVGVPEPSTLMIMLLGLVGLAVRKLKIQKA